MPDVTRLSRRTFGQSLGATLALTALPGNTAAQRDARHAVAIHRFAFEPATLTISRGDTVTWTNRDTAPHTATADRLEGAVRMGEKLDLEVFQEALDRVARNGEREEVDEHQVPEVRRWDRLDSRGCVISVERGRWWILPPERGNRPDSKAAA